MQHLRLLARGFKWDAEDQDSTFAAVLKVAARARITENKTGRVLIGSAGNGKSVTFALPTSTGLLSPADIMAMVSELLDRYDEAQENLEEAGTENPTDDQIYAELFALLVDVTEVTPDFSEVRCR